MTQYQPARCRRCDRLLRDHLSARAGVGARCSQYEAAEAAEAAQEPAQGLGRSGAHTVALAAVAALVHDLPGDVVDSIVGTSDTDVTMVLAGLLVWCIRETHGGAAWLERTALDWAQQGVD